MILNKYQNDLPYFDPETYASGHGKGPCDWLGGCAKRQATATVKQGKVNIQDAQDFYKWAIANEKSISYSFYPSDDY